MNEPGALTPTGVAVLTSMNADYRRKVIKALEGMKPEMESHRWCRTCHRYLY
jgi:hypothetical protein